MNEPDSRSAVPEPPQLTVCQRCGRHTPVAADHCLVCSAPIPGRAPRPRVIHANHVPESTHRGVTWLFWIFSLQLLVNVVISWYLRGRPDDTPLPENVVRQAAMALTIAEVIDAALVIIAAITCSRFIKVPTDLGQKRRTGWIVALPILACLLLINIGYHTLLMTIAGIEPEGDLLMQSGHHRIWLLALMCIQPAIIEELFFRRLVFDFFRSHTTMGTAAFASAVMFAAAHTGGFLSIPYLALFGFTMAWLRWMTGSLTLPIILHFLHNLLISLNELATA